MSRARSGVRPRTRRILLPALAAVGVLVVLTGLALGGLRLARAGALPGAELPGAHVGGLEREELATRVADYGQQRADTRVTISHAGSEITTSAEELGYQLDEAATTEAILARGRQRNPLAALSDHLRASLGAATRVKPVEQVDADILNAWIEESAPKLAEEPVEATLTFNGSTVEPVSPEAGTKIRTHDLRADLRARLLGDRTTADGGPVRELTVTAQANRVDPDTTQADLETVAAEARHAVSDEVTLTRDDESLAFSPADIGELLTVERTGTDRDGRRLALTIHPDDLVEHLPTEAVERLEAEPVDAEVGLQNGAVVISESQDGFAFSPETAAEQLLDVATSSGSRSAELEGEVLEPEVTKAELEDLRIEEQVSSFTTHFTPDQPRVTNIRRIAEIVDGTLIRPGETFSLNGHVGPRTAAKGFVPGGAIFDGEFVEDVGGGVSQFATTLYNAAYFGGYAIPQHKAHSYYISRYPVGREATLDYPTVDLKIRNNSPHGALVTTSSTGSSVTVSIWGTTWVEVDSEAGERTNVRKPETQVRENPELPPGERRVVQSGREGFDITVVRVLRFPDGKVERQPESTRYQAQPRIIEQGSSSPPEDADANGEGQE